MGQRETGSLLHRGFSGLASLKLTVGLLLALMVVLILGAQEVVESEWPRVALLFALGLNLAATVVRRWKSFKRKPGLLGFHLALITLTSVAGVGRLVHQEALFQIVEGQRRSLESTVRDRGPLAPTWLRGVQVWLDGLEARYHRTGTQLAAEAHLRVSDADGELRSILVKPGAAVTVDGVRYTLKSPAGFGALFSLRRPDGRSEQGAILFPEYRLQAQAQVQVLNLPGVDGAIAVELELPDLKGAGESWRLAAPPEARLSLIFPGQTEAVRLAVGESLVLPQGRLTLEGLPRYARISAPYDPVWPIVVTLFAALPFFLLWHYLWTQRGRRRPGEPGA